MQDPHVHSRALEYETPPVEGREKRNRLVMVLLLVAAAMGLLVVLAGGVFFTRTSVRVGPAPALIPPPSAAVPAAGAAQPMMVGSGFAVELNGGGNVDYDGARAATERLLDDLLAGRLDADAALAPIARKVKGYRSWSVTSQRKSNNVPSSWTFSGTMDGPGGASDFAVMMVRQQGGQWAVGTFRGPERK